ncbi:radical SAM protein [Pseudomonas aeruginosa]|uniref:radical SAM protein n=1 Tax=Pseudomonas aeruginosa TaxID=287 RepID=UPI000659582B|nr:radical SAM protein [Pseudomonas aeruginosa]CRP99463.1 molybdenum cofactor biosynthesis protein A [Pseudomonas aeruginosa]
MMELMEETFHIRELEISITSRCTLACAHCGFLVPEQPSPSIGEPVAEIAETLANLFKAGVRVQSLAVLGGEPTIDGRLLERALTRFSAVGIAERLEVVTNGLTPRGLTKASLQHIDRLSISVYGLGDAILDRYRTWISLVAPHLELIFRMNDEGWDPWSDQREVSAAQAQAMFDDCWYRRHCATVERGRLFVCSRIAKLSRDDEGLAITTGTTLEDVRAYMNRILFLPACATCTPMMGLELVPAGVQPDDRIPRLEARAIDWLDAEIRRAEARIV